MGEKRHWRTPMIKLLILVEGQTEELFVNRVLAPYLAKQRIHCFPKLIITKGNFKGGLVSWGKAQNHLNALFASEKTAFISTMLDFYNFPTDLPGYPLTDVTPAQARSQAIESAMQACFPYAAKRFIPYLNLHEFEALLFACPATIAAYFETDAGKQQALIALLQKAGLPEEINHGPLTHPAKRLENSFSYGKKTDGATLAEKIGIEKIMQTCPHFAAWVRKLCAFGNKEN